MSTKLDAHIVVKTEHKIVIMVKYPNDKHRLIQIYDDGRILIGMEMNADTEIPQNPVVA